MDAKLLYDLTPEEFERLIVALLDESGYSDLRILDGPSDRGIDIIGKFNNETVAIIVKHKKYLGLDDIIRSVKAYFSDPTKYGSLVFVTSAEITPQVKASFGKIREQLQDGRLFRCLGYQDIISMIDAYPKVANRFFGLAKRRLTSRRYQLAFGILGIVFSIAGGLMSLYPMLIFPQAALDKRIQTVENALTSMRDLEKYLEKIKQDMVETEKATQLINERYAQAKELEKLTQDQVNAIRATLQAESWQRTIFNYAMGFVLGVASSFVASVLYSRWRQIKALE